MILYIRDLEDSIHNFFQNVAGYRIKLQKLVAFLLHQQQPYREGDHGHTPIPNSHKESKISRDKPREWRPLQ